VGVEVADPEVVVVIVVEAEVVELPEAVGLAAPGVSPAAEVVVAAGPR
jgi:hypothetical protein